MATDPKTLYCPGCGDNMEFYTMSTNMGEVNRCQVCSALLHKDEPPAPQVGSISNVIVVEDTALLREILSDIIRGRGLAQNVISCQNGAQFVTTFTGMQLRKEVAGLLVIDINMPIMNGINAAIATRAIEKAFRVVPAPILFFTVKQCDDKFRKVLKYCSPAMYINKGQDASPQQMQRRVEKVVAQLIDERQREAGQADRPEEEPW